jgi:hypothetical protein
MKFRISSIKVTIFILCLHSASVFGDDFRFCYLDREMIQCPSSSQVDVESDPASTNGSSLFCYQGDEIIPCEKSSLLEPAQN